jgi:Flp pilus assembly protein TadG
MSNQQILKRRRQSGIAVMMTALFLLILIPIVGLAIDGGLAFIVRSRLASAVDSAALAAGRGLSSGATQTAAEASGTTAATNFLFANFPPGYLNTTYPGNTSNNYNVTATFVPSTSGTLQITVTATVNSPTYFIRWLGVNSIPVTAIGQATRPNLVVVLVLDKSSSMGTRNSSVGTMPTSINYSTASSCEAMVYNANAFTQNFSPFDTIAEISFDATVDIDYAPSTNYKASGSAGVAAAIANIQCGSNTNTTGALAQAAAVLNAVNQPAALNHIVLFTDGVANGVNAAFPVRTSASLGGHVDYRMGPGPPICTGCTTTQTNNNITACQSGGPLGPTNSVPMMCNMTTCATSGTTITGVITQVSGYDVDGGTMNMFPAFSSTYPYTTSITGGADANPAIPTGCSTTTYPNYSTAGVVQTMVANIPALDRFNNSTSSPWGSTTWDGIIEQVNPSTAPSGIAITPGNLATKNLTGLWSAYPTVGTGTAIPGSSPGNKFPSGPFSGYFRPDLPNTIGVVSMNTAVNEAIQIRTNAAAGTNPATFAHPTNKYTVSIDAVYLQGNGGDPVDPYFLQYLTNQQNLTVPSCIYTATSSSYVTTYTTNPHFISTQAQGAYASTGATSQLASAFSQIAASLLRIN